MILDVKSYVKQEKEKLMKKASEPMRKMLIIQVGDNPASNAYIKGKIKDAVELGHQAMLMKFPDGASADDIYDFIKNNEVEYDGIILQEPANITINKKKVSYVTKEGIISQIKDWKDIDGFKRTSAHIPATPRGIMDYLEYLGYSDFKGKIVAVVGKGKLVGEPLVPMLMKKGATVISCNSTTPNLEEMLWQADIIIAATGVRNLIQNEMVKDGALVIDAGISVDENGKLCGDCSKELYDREHVDITPVPGGVGLLTRLALMKNLLGR